MYWVLWILLFAIINIPILTLLADRILAVPAPRVIKSVWVPAAVLLGGLLIVAQRAAPSLLELLMWGLVGGFVASIGLDVVRLFGHHVLKAFPVDMPQVFGLLAMGLGPGLQENMIATMVGRIAEAAPDMQRRMLGDRLTAMAKLPEPVRLSVVRAMRKGLSGLPEERRLGLMQTQMAVLAELPGPARRLVMEAMDRAIGDGPEPPAPVYAQPRGMPQIPMRVARDVMAAALPKAVAEAGVSRAAVLLAGYGWHLLNGLGLGAAYTLLFGAGTWTLAITWGIFIWAGMMATMPLMMPMIRFPMPRFLIVPFIAHIVMAGPIGFFALKASHTAAAGSLLGLVLK